MFTIRGHGAMSWSDETISSGAIRIISLIGRGRFGEVILERFLKQILKFCKFRYMVLIILELLQLNY